MLRKKLELCILTSVRRTFPEGWLLDLKDRDRGLHGEARLFDYMARIIKIRNGAAGTIILWKLRFIEVDETC